MTHPDARRTRVEDVHELALAMPHVTVEQGPATIRSTRSAGSRSSSSAPPGRTRSTRDTGERYPDVIVFWVGSEADKQALVQDESSPFFTTPHFDGHPSVLLRASRIGELTRDELAEVVQDAWLSRASARRAAPGSDPTAWPEFRSSPDRPGRRAGMRRGKHR